MPPGPTYQAEGDEEPNDTYVEQLTACAQAAVDELQRRGVSDPSRIAVAGHSYGAPLGQRCRGPTVGCARHVGMPRPAAGVLHMCWVVHSLLCCPRHPDG